MISKLTLSKFRNFKTQRVEFSDGITVIIGPNASGKTNILEAIFLLSTGKSFKARIEEEMISHNSDIARVSGKIGGPHFAKASWGKGDDLEVLLTRGLIDIGSARPEKAPRKRLLVNGVPKRLVDFTGNFKTVLFGPWDLDLVTETPTLRRRFLDNAISQVDREYRRAVLSYEKGLRQRNRLLFRIREEGYPRSQLLFWNQLLIRNGDYITICRQNFIDFVNSQPALDSQNFSVEYDKSAISEARLTQYAQEEIAAATTLVGPHRDDFIVKLKGKNEKAKSRDLARFGSRGEQRMGVLWLKLAELEFIAHSSVDSASLTIRGESGRPTLLLDDIFSELDHEHRQIVIDAAQNQQTIITTADPHFVEGLKGVVKVELGR